MNKLFVYGIFLDEGNREQYGMTNPEYATVRGYITVGRRIVAAVKVEPPSVCLTGLIVDVDPTCWKKLDKLEGGYDRVVITTTDNQQAYMYQGK